MEFLVILIVGVVLGIPTIAIIALVRSATTRRLAEENAAELRNKITDLRGEVATLRRELTQVSERVAESGARVPSPAEKPQPVPAAVLPAPSQEPQRSPVEERPSSPPAVPVVADARPAAVAPPLPVSAQVPTAPALAQTGAEPEAEPTSASHSAPVTLRPAMASASQSKAEEAAPSLPPRLPVPPPLPATPRIAPPPYQPPQPVVPPRFAAAEPKRESILSHLRHTLPLEELLGVKFFAKASVVLLVFGFALLGRMEFAQMAPSQRVALLYAVAAGLLGAGVWLETKERYRIIGRAGIGGGWALLFFTTYAMYYVTPMRVLASNTTDCVLMLIVAAGMVFHTLRYKSQVVTGLAFLLAFSTVTLSQDSVYSLTAGVILAVGIAALALRMQWYELEAVGIVASYANHFYWLYKLYPNGVRGHAFPQFWPSVIILVLYWLIFRVSYVTRTIHSRRHETTSTAAALLNTVLLLAVMKFQSLHPELAFYALLALGALEFFFGQLPITRRRQPAFLLLTIMGTVLMFASVPFKYSGNSIALFWMIAAELLLIAGLILPEVVFRRLGLIAGVLTGLLVTYEARQLVELRRTSELPQIQSGILLLTCSLLLCGNAQFVRRKWKRYFTYEIDSPLATMQGYLGAVTALLGVWAIFTRDWTAIGWAALLLLTAFGKRKLNDNHLLAQAWAFTAVVLVRCATVNLHLNLQFPQHSITRLITLPLLALAFYSLAWILSGVRDARVFLRLPALWAGSSLFAVLAWLDVNPTWVAPVWVVFAIVLLFAARRFAIAEFCYQEHVLAAAAIVQLMTFNLDAMSAVERYVPFLACALAFYCVSRFCTPRFSVPIEAPYRRYASWAHTWAATGLVAALAWHESGQPWIAAIWAAMALVCALIDRIFTVEELPWQAHVLALLAVLRAVTVNMYLGGSWHGVRLRLITVSIVVAVLYTLARWVRMPALERAPELRHAYTWLASALAVWLMWGELTPVGVALGWAAFGLLLFEIGAWKEQRQLRWQGFVALAAAFVRIFFVNLTAEKLPGELLSPRVYTVVPMALIYFYVWSRLQHGKSPSDLLRPSATALIAYFGTGCISAVLYFETSPEWIVAALALLALALMLAALLFDRKVFLQQAILVVAGVSARALAHNIFGGSYFFGGGWHGNFPILLLTAALLLCALPIAFKLRARYAERPVNQLDRILAIQYPEQVFFFAPAALIALLIAMKMNPGMITLSWGVEGVAVILLGLVASQRSYRLTGLLLLLLCVGKIVIRDAWHLGDRDRYITFIALGAALFLVSILYSKYRETVRKLL